MQTEHPGVAVSKLVGHLSLRLAPNNSRGQTAGPNSLATATQGERSADDGSRQKGAM